MTNQVISVSAMHSVLAPQALLSMVVPLYQVTAPNYCKILHQGINDSYVISSDEGNYLLRIYRKGWRTLSDIEFEMEVLSFLHDKGANVAYPIEKTGGGYITCIHAPEGLRYAIITSYAEGEELKYEDIADAAQYGKAVAQVHELSDSFKVNHSRFELDLAHLVDEPLERIKPYLAHRLEDWDFLCSYASILSKQVIKSQTDLLDYGFCHGDFHGWNAHRHLDEITFFDFDCCGMGLRAYDLAVFKWSARLRKKENEWWDAFLKAYKAVRYISDDDLGLVDVFISIRHIWLMGLHTAIASDQSWLDDAYFDREIKFLRDAAEANDQAKIRS